MDRTSIWCLDYVYGREIMPKGKGTYGSKRGRPKKKRGGKKKKGMKYRAC